MSLDPSPEEIANATARLDNVRLNSDDEPRPGGSAGNPEIPEGEVSGPGMPQNMQSGGRYVLVPTHRTRRNPERELEEDLVPLNPRNGESSNSVCDNRPPSNAVNALNPETARARSNIINNIARRPARATYNWQGGKATLRERFAYLFNNEILSDVKFMVGRGAQQQLIPAHKLVLASGSAVFDAMFNGTLATAADEIEVPDVEPVTFLAVLLFLYTDEIQIDPDTVMATLYTAKKYAVSPLEKHCVDFLRNNLTTDNAFLLLAQARLFDEPQLAALCLDTIDKFTTETLSADGFTDIDMDTLVVVLQRDTLHIKESKIFQAIVRWSEAECVRQQLPMTPENQRFVLGKALSLVRFPLMSTEEFASGPAQSGLLPDREVVQLLLHFILNPKPQVGFQVTPRCSMKGKEQTVCRFEQTTSKWGYNGTSDRIKFNVDRSIYLVGYGVYGSYYKSAEYKVVIEILHSASTTVIAKNATSFSCDGSSYTYRLMFKEPVEIFANTYYTASAIFQGPDSHYGSKGMRKVCVDCGSERGKVTFTFQYEVGDNNGTGIERGQIPELLFYIK